MGRPAPEPVPGGAGDPDGGPPGHPGPGHLHDLEHEDEHPPDGHAGQRGESDRGADPGDRRPQAPGEGDEVDRGGGWGDERGEEVQHPARDGVGDGEQVTGDR